MLVIGEKDLVGHDLVDFDPSALQIGKSPAKAVNLRERAFNTISPRNKSKGLNRAVSFSG